MRASKFALSSLYSRRTPYGQQGCQETKLDLSEGGVQALLLRDQRGRVVGECGGNVMNDCVYYTHARREAATYGLPSLLLSDGELLPHGADDL